MERQAVASADIVMTLNSSVTEWMRSAGWQVSSSVREVSHLGDGLQAWGEWLNEQMQKAVVPKGQDKVSISVCIVAGANASYLADTLQSLVAQDTEAFEVVVLENGDVDTSIEQLRKQLAPLFTKRHWRWEHQSKTPLHEACNKIATLATGSHLYFLENGVLCLPEALQTYTNAHSADEADILTSIPAFESRRGDLCEAVVIFPAPKSVQTDELLVAWIPPGACTTMAPILDIFGPCSLSIKRSAFLALGGFHSMDDGPGALLTRALLMNKKVSILPDVLSWHFYTKKRPSRTSALQRSAGVIRYNTEAFPVYVADALNNLSAIINVSPYDGGRRSQEAWYKLHLPRSIPANTDVPSVFKTKTQPAGPINVCIVFDDHYIQPACVAINSLFANTRARVDVYALTAVSATNADLLRKIAARYNQIIHVIPTSSVKSKVLHGASYFSNATDIAYAYTWMPEYLPEDVKRIIFLDSDLLVRDDIAKLWNVDLDGEIVAAMPEYFVNSLSDAKRNYPHDEFNAGVMVLDIESWRKSTITEDAVNWITYQEQNPHRCQFWSQTAFNMAVAGRWVSLPISWNTTAHALHRCCLNNGINSSGEDWIRKSASIYHFAGPDKPWQKDFMVTAPHAGEYHMHVRMLANAFPEATCFDNM